jgi:hypothetical protein
MTGRLFAQDSTLVQKTYLKVIKTGISTAPDFIVVKIKDLNTGESKEICTTANFFFGALSKEQIPGFNKSYMEYLLSKSADRTFELKKSDALKNIGFFNYHLQNETHIDSLIKNNHLRDSLKNLSKVEIMVYKEFNLYEQKRDTLLQEFSRRMKKNKPLSTEENQIIDHLSESVSYEDTYDNSKMYDYKKLSREGLQFMALWLNTIRNDKQKYRDLEEERGRLYKKLFQMYFDKYGLSFCHVAFNNGIITYIGDEVAVIGYSSVVD